MVPQNEQSQLSFMLRFNIILELIPKINLALNWVSKSIVCSQIQKKNQIDREKKQGWSITSEIGDPKKDLQNCAGKQWSFFW